MDQCISLQLFYQPSLTASYLRNNKSMTAYDFTLIFPSIGLQFGISSDLASAWSKLVYEQVLMNRNQQKIEVEIQGLSEKEAFIVEECVKLLFGFKIEICSTDIWVALKVSELLGLTQSPQVDCLTVQEQLLTYALGQIHSINIVEAWDYVVQVTESGGEGLLVHRSQIKGLATEIHCKIKEMLVHTKFEVLSQYAHSLEQSDGVLDNANKFQLKDLKREHYIQLRTLFYSAINEQKEQLSSNQAIVKVLFDELDSHYELDGYINKYFDNVGQKLDTLEQTMADQSKYFTNQIEILTTDFNKQLQQVNQENKILKNQLLYAQNQIRRLSEMQIVCSSDLSVICYSNGIIKVIDVGVIHTDTILGQQILCVSRMKEQILIGIQGGDILCYDMNTLEQVYIMKPNTIADVQTIYVSHNYLLSSYNDGQFTIWWNQQNLFTETLVDPITCLFSHINYGNFIIAGDKSGTIQFLYLNEAKQSLCADHIKKMKNSDGQVTHLSNLGIMTDLLASAHNDMLICIWNWEMENLISAIKLDDICYSLQVYQISGDLYIRVLLKNGYITDYSAAQGNTLIDSIYIGSNVLTLVQNQCLTKFGNVYKLASLNMVPPQPLCLSHPHLQLQSTLKHHRETCVYGLLLINYPYFASSSDDKSIVIFNVYSQERLLLLGHEAYVRAITLLQGGNLLMSGSYDTTIKIWDMTTGVCINTLCGHIKPVLCIATLHHTATMCVSGGEDAIVKTWNWRNGQCVWSVDQGKNEIWSLLNISEHQAILVGNKDGSIRVIHTGESGSKSQTVQELKPHKSFVNCIIQLGNELIASASSDNTIAITDFRLGQTIRTLIGHNSIVWSLQIIDDSILISSSTEGKVKVWNWKNGHCLNSQLVSKGSIYVLLKSFNKVLGGTANGDILMWRLKDFKCNTI